jgi:hypothetical protein
LVLAPAVPATWVPWPFVSEVSVELAVVKFLPAATLPDRSGWLALMPVSRMAILTAALPVVPPFHAVVLAPCHASKASISNVFGAVADVLLKPHCSPTLGSFGPVATAS